MRYLEHKTEVGVLRNPLIKRRYLRPCIIFAVVALLAFFNFVAIYKLTERRDIGGNEGCSFATPPTSQQFNSDDPLPKLETDWRQTTGMKYFDIGVPCQGQDKKLVDFATVLGDSIREYLRRSGHNNTEFRLIVTRYKSDDSSRSFRHELADKTSLDLENIIFASTEEPDFHRAFAINLLHEKTRKTADSVLAIVDVDLNVGPRFLFNSLTKVSKNSTYFPIVFSQFRPSNVLLVEKFLGPLPRYSEHRGIWRDFGYGMYSISGLDAKEILMNETFVGWGGEDNDFFGRVNKTKQMIVIREKEYDLVHIW